MTTAAQNHNPDPQSTALMEPTQPDWSRPLPNGLGCGPNLEYDNRFLAVVQAAQGRPETQFESAVQPDWAYVERESLILLNESRDLRLALLLAHSQLALHGLASVVPVLVGMARLIRDCWTVLNPPLDDGDAYPRVQLIESMGPGGAFFGTLRSALVYRHAALGELCVRDFEILAGHLQGPNPGCNREQLQQVLLSHPEALFRLVSVVESWDSALHELSLAVTRFLPQESFPAIDSIKRAFRDIRQLLPELSLQQEPPKMVDVGSVDEPAALSLSDWNRSVVVSSRAQALAAIDSVCRYLDQAEPTSPAQWLLKRARRLIDKNFLELVRDLAPDALADVARIMGVDPRSMDDPDSSR